MLSLTVGSTADAQICTPYLASLPKDSRLYLYFPTADDATFPTDTLGNISGVNSQPLTAFTPANLDADLTATAAQLRSRITEQVRDSYCEFSVDVIESTTDPAPTGTAWQVVGIGADTEPGNRFGRAEDVDTGDADTEDYARVWATEFHDAYGATGNVLSPANATLENWSTAIAGTVAHEAGHNYGLPHSSSAPRAGTTEDGQNNHLLATGSTGLTGAQRLTRRHFSDTSFETLAYNIGLNTKTLSNWDFSNPNDTDATGLRIRLLSEAATLSLTRVYSGNLSPWTNPTLTKQAGTQTFRGTTYNIFDLVFTTGTNWSNGASGVVPPGVQFHVGAGVDADAVVYDVVLTDAGGDMDLHPRMFGYGFGLADDTADIAGAGVIQFFAPDDAEDDLLIENVMVRFVPRPVSLQQMVAGGQLLSEEQLPVEPFLRSRLAQEGSPEGISARLERAAVPGVLAMPIAHLTDHRHFELTIEPTAICDAEFRTRAIAGAGPFDRVGPDEELYCDAGDYLSLFPATNIFVTATVVDPSARYFDPSLGMFVEGRQESRLYAQIAGVIPDFDGNGRDDYLDIRDGGTTDRNRDGIPDQLYDWSIYAGAGSTDPQASGLGSSGSATIRIDRHFANRISIGVGLGYHEFDAPSGADDPRATEISARAGKSLRVAPRTDVFYGGGVGAYSFDPGSTEYGIQVGAGIRYRIRSRIEIEFNIDRHEISDSRLDFTTAHAGIRVNF